MELLIVLFVLYFLFLVVLLAGWKKIFREPDSPAKGKDPMLSVVIPMRNEEMTIGSLLADLSRQEYTNFEIIIVNDDSQDETLWMASQSRLANLRALHSKGAGKKAAISTGVRAAKGAIVVTTDADCSVPPQWLRQISNSFRDSSVKMVFGGVRMKDGGSFFDALQSMEFVSLIGSGAATAALGFPTMCNGANLAFRKKVFSEVKGYGDNMHIPSGDDEFLLHKVHMRYPDGIRFMQSPESVVSTNTQPDFRALAEQRIRWASKWRFSRSWHGQALAVLVVVFQLAFLFNLGLLFTPAILQASFLLVIKMILEASLLLQVAGYLRAKWNWLAFFSLQVIYPLYVVGAAVASFFSPFRWKNRIFKPGLP